MSYRAIQCDEFLEDPGILNQDASNAQRLASRQFRTNAVLIARQIAHSVGLPWEKVEPLSMTLSASFSVPLVCHDDDAWESLCATERTVREAFGRCHSPIEELFLTELSHLRFRWSVDGRGTRVGYLYNSQTSNSVGGLRDICEVHAQFPILNYRADFAFIGNETKLAIELDGHEFHERTKEQAARDKSRDRAMVAEGWVVLRFTGSELWRDPKGCIIEATGMIKEWVRL